MKMPVRALKVAYASARTIVRTRTFVLFHTGSFRNTRARR